MPANPNTAHQKCSALILDRDGTLNAMILNPQGKQDSPYFTSQLELYPHLGDLLLPWVKAHIPIFIVTNQPGVAKGNFTREDLAAVHTHLKNQLLSQGIQINDIFFCMHHPTGTPHGALRGDLSLIGPCECRKPRPGMLFQLRERYGIDLSQAVYIGDSPVDQEAAKNAGIQHFFAVRTFISQQVPPEKRVIPFPQAESLAEILRQTRRCNSSEDC